MITMTMKKTLSGMKDWRIVMLIFMLSFIAVAPPLAQAAIPRYINYQGRLTDADDNPVIGDVTITVRIYDVASGGTALWTEAHLTTVTKGTFNILLGNTEVLDNLDFNNPYWYSVEVESDGEMTPRQRLTSVAYAINADKIDGYDASQFLRSDTDTELTGNLTVTGGAITSGANEDIIIDPTGTGNVVVKIDSTSGDFKITDNTTNWVLVDSATGNVSIAKDLTVSGTIYGQISATSGDSTFSSIVVTGTSDLRGNISNSGASNGGAVNIADSLSQTGADNQVSFAGNLDAGNGLDVTGALTVSGQTTLSDALDMNSNLDLDYSGASAALSVDQAGAGPSAQFTGQRVVVGSSEITNTNAVATGELYVQGDLEVDGTIYGDITSTGDTAMGDATMETLTVTGASDLRGDISDTTGVLTIADNLLVSGSAITSSGTDDYAVSIAQTLNDSNAAGGSDVYRGIKLNLTETNNTGWDNVYLMDLRAGADGTIQKFYVDNSGNTKIAGSLTIGSTALSETSLIDLTDGGATALHVHTGLMPGEHASTHMTGSDKVYWSQLERAEGVATTVSSEIDSDISTHADLTATHGVSGAIVGTTDTQALSNKTLTNPLISQIYGGSADNSDISIDGTSSVTKATSYVLLQSGGGSVGIGTATPNALLDMYNKPANGSGAVTTALIKPDYSLLNTAGDGYSALKINVTEAQAGADGAKNLLNLQVADISKFIVTNAGNVTAAGDLTIAGGDITGAGLTAIDMGEATPGIVAITGGLSTTNDVAITGGLSTTGDLDINGVGTSDFAGSLTVHGTLTAENLTGTTASTGTTSETFTLNSDNTADQTAILTFGGADTGSGKIATTVGALNIQPAANSNINLTLSGTGDFAVNTNHLYVDTSEGKVGIGTTVPGQKLQVIGNIHAADSAAADADGTLYLGSDNGSPHYFMWDNDYVGKDSLGADVTGWFKSDEGVSVKNLEIRGASPATITFGSGATSKQMQFDSSTQEFSFTGGKLQQQFQNLVRGGDFETYNPSGWYSYWTTWYTTYISNTCGYSVTLDGANIFKFGKKSLCIWDDKSDYTAFMSYYVDAWQRLRGKYITLSVWARAEGNNSARASIGIATDYSTEATQVVNIDLKYDTVNDTPWKNFTQTFFVPITAQTLRVYIYAAAGTSGGVPTPNTKTTDAYSGDGITGANSVYYDGVTLTEGKLALPFGPSPLFDSGDQRIGGSLAIGADIDPYSNYGQNYYNYPRIIFGEPDQYFGGYSNAYTAGGYYYNTYGGGTGEMSFRRMGSSSGMFAFNRPIGVDTHDTYDYWNTWAKPGLFIGSLYSYGSSTVDTPDYAWAPSDAYIKGVLEADGGIYGDIMAGGYGGVGKSSNLLKWSESFNNSVWEKNTGSVNVSSGSLAPDGNNTAFLLTNNGGTSIEQEVSASPDTTYTFSVYLAPGTSFYATLYLKTDNPASSWSEWPLNYKNASLSYDTYQPWRRFSISYKTQTSNVSHIRARIGDIYGSIKAWGAQLRQSSSPGIYVYTTSTPIDSAALFHGDGSGITNLTATNMSGTAAITGISGNTFNIGSDINAAANDINLAFGDSSAGQQILTYAGSGSTPAADIFKFSDDLMINSSANTNNTDVVLSFGGANPETLKFTGAGGTKNFVFSDIVDATGFKVSGANLASNNLADGAQIAHIDASETITGGWNFDTLATNFTTDVNMVYAGAENLTITSAASSAVDAVTLDVTATNAGVVRGIIVSQNANSTQPVDVGLEIANLDTNTAMGTAIKITPTGTITTGLDLGGTLIANSGNITGLGALILSSGSASDLNLTGTNGVNVTATAQDIALNATTATSGGVSITGPGGASIDVGGVADGVIGLSSPSVNIDKDDTGTLNLRSGAANYLSLGADEAITLGNGAAPTALTVNASTLNILPADNSTVKIAANKTFAVKDHSNQAIISMDDATRTLSVYNLNVNGTQTVINTTTTDADHLALSPGAIGTTAISIEPDSGITLTGNLITAKNANGGSDVFAIDKDGNITTAGTYRGYTIAHSTHAQNTDTGTSQDSFKIADTLDANANNVTLAFGNINSETIIFQGSSADKDFVFSDKIVAAGFDSQSQGITNVGNISDDANINIDLKGGTDKTLAILNSDAGGVTNVTVDGSLTADRILFDNSTLNSDTWATSGVNNIALSPGGAKVLPGTHESYNLGDAAAIGASVFSGAGALTMSVTGSDAYVDASRIYVVKLDTAGDIGTATFKWSRDNGATWVQGLKATSANDTPLENGIAVKFGGSGGAINDQWTIPVTANIGWKAMYAKKISTDSIYVPAIYPESSGGSITIGGSIAIQGDLNVTGAQTITGSTQYQGAQTITATSSTAFLVENGTGVDAFIVDTATPQVNILTNLDTAGTITAGDSNAFQVASNGAITSFGLNAGSGNITTTGSITTTAGGVMTSAGLLTASAGMSLSGGNLAITDASNIVVNSDKFIIYGATGNTVIKGFLTQSNSIGMIPEYDNATPIGDGDDNFGTLCVLYQAPHNYYEWTTGEPTTQDYDIVLRYRLPEGFSEFDATAPVKIWNKVSANTANTFITITMLDTNGVDVPLINGSNLKNTDWTENTIAMNTTGKTLTPGGYITIKIRMSADQGQKVDVGELSLKGNW